MNIYELADILNVQLIVTRYANQESRFSAKFEQCETKDGGCLCSEYGNGKTATEAINKYSDAIAGKLLVFNAMTDKRREFVAPKMERVVA